MSGIIRRATGALRARTAPPAHVALADRERALRQEARNLLARGLRSESGAARDALLLQAAAAWARADAAFWATGGDTTTAAAMGVLADEATRRADKVAAKRQEASHA